MQHFLFVLAENSNVQWLGDVGGVSGQSNNTNVSVIKSSFDLWNTQCYEQIFMVFTHRFVRVRAAIVDYQQARCSGMPC